MKMLHIEKPDPELRNEIISIWPYGLFELWDNGDVVIKAEAVSRGAGCWHFFTLTKYCHIHMVIPVNKTAHIRKIMRKEGD